MHCGHHSEVRRCLEWAGGRNALFRYAGAVGKGENLEIPPSCAELSLPCSARSGKNGLISSQAQQETRTRHSMGSGHREG